MRNQTLIREARPQKQKYVPDLVSHMAVCDANYLRLKKLLGDLNNDRFEFAVAEAADSLAKIAISIVERCPYTTTLEISQINGDGQWLAAPLMTVRLYHDARTAEVIAFQQQSRFNGSYEYPNQNMYHRNEKAQLNKFLGEWLSHCLSMGRSLQPVIFSSP